MDFEAIKKAAQAYGPDMTRFLRDMIAIPSESCEEKGVAHRIAEEMKKLGYDKVEFDALGNVIGWMGSGDKIIAIDSHIDTVGIGNRENWTHDPYEGYEDDKVIYGRGGSDQEGGMAAAAYGTKIMKDLGLIPEGYKIMVVGSVHVLAVHRQRILQGSRGCEKPDRIRHLHRADRRWHLPRSPRPHGDPRRHARRLLPRLRA
jgi:putative selenium metabolism hydrolase